MAFIAQQSQQPIQCQKRITNDFVGPKDRGLVANQASSLSTTVDSVAENVKMSGAGISF